MIEQLFSVLPEWAKSKIAIRIAYTLGSLAAAHAITFLSMPAVQGVLAKIFVDPHLQPGAAEFLKTAIIGLVMTAGEFVIERVHDNHVKPVVAPAPQGGTPL